MTTALVASSLIRVGPVNTQVAIALDLVIPIGMDIVPAAMRGLSDPAGRGVAAVELGRHRLRVLASCLHSVRIGWRNIGPSPDPSVKENASLLYTLPENVMPPVNTTSQLPVRETTGAFVVSP